jgi:hypothetical protein
VINCGELPYQGYRDIYMLSGLRSLQGPTLTTGQKDTLRIAIVVCGGVPFLFFLQTAWGHAALLGYLLTGLFFGVALVADYPPVGTTWFWKAMIPVVVLHSAIVFGLVWVDLKIPEVNRAPRFLYGIATIMFMLEWRWSGRIIEALQPTRR